MVVTGATGFLGKKVVFALKSLGYLPIALGRNSFIGKQFEQAGIPFISIDLSHRDQMIKAFHGADLAINSAGLSSIWGSKSDFYEANVMGVQNVIDACQLNGIKRLVHISTPSLYFDYQNQLNLTELSPLPKKLVNEYARSKRLGEDLIQDAFSSGLSTVVLRPRGIFGPGDTTIFPRILSAMEKGQLPLINNGEAVMDVTYVDNVADAIILALERENIDGQIYNITNDEPKTFLELLTLLCEKVAIPLKTRNVSFVKAYAAAKIVESIYRMLQIKKEPPLTCYSVGLVSTSMTFDITKAKLELGYKPRVSIEDGFDAFANFWRVPCKKR